MLCSDLNVERNAATTVLDKTKLTLCSDDVIIFGFVIFCDVWGLESTEISHYLAIICCHFLPARLSY